MTREDALAFVMRAALELCDAYDATMAREGHSDRDMALGTVNELNNQIELSLKAIAVMSAPEQFADTVSSQEEMLKGGAGILMYAATLACAAMIMAPRLADIPVPEKGVVH